MTSTGFFTPQQGALPSAVPTFSKPEPRTGMGSLIPLGLGLAWAPPLSLRHSQTAAPNGWELGAEKRIGPMEKIVCPFQSMSASFAN